MDVNDAAAFVQEWVDAWNAHDIDRVVAHYRDDAVFSSPVAAQLLDHSDGVLRGKAELRAYWQEGFRRIPELHFEVLDLYLGVDVVVINYRNQRGGLVCEVLRFEGDDVVEGHGTYADRNGNPAGATA